MADLSVIKLPNNVSYNLKDATARGYVRSIATGSSNGTISVNTGGTTANVPVKGLGSVAYLSTGSSTTTYLRNDGTWAAPPTAVDEIAISSTEPEDSGTKIWIKI